MSTDEVKKAIIARFAHEANRLRCLLLGDESQTTWEHDRLPPEQKAKDHIFHFAVKVELLANPEKLESPDQSKGMEALVAKMLPVIKNELYERGNAATCLPEDRHVAWALMKGLLAISDVLNVPKALMSQQDAAVSVSKSMGQIGYEAYAESTNQKTFDGRDMPSWNQFREREGDEPKVTRAREAAAAKIAERCRDLK